MPADATTHRMRLKPLTVLLVLSLLVHVVILGLIALYSGKREQPQRQSSPTLTINLKKPASAPKPPPEVTESASAPLKKTVPAAKHRQAPQEPEQVVHLPRHNAEKTDLSGTDFESPVTNKPVRGRESGDKPSINKRDRKTRLAEGRPDKPEASKKPEKTKSEPPEPEVKNKETTKASVGQPAKSVTTTANAKTSTTPATDRPPGDAGKATRKKQAALKMTAPKQQALNDDDVPQGMKVMSDKELSGTQIGDPFSEIEARRIRMVNRYLERMQQQVRAHFRPPAGITTYREGVVVFELGPSGYLEFSHLARSSGNPLLDATALEAVRAVPRFDVPESRKIAARYYRNLRFRFSSEEQSSASH